jgi:acyl CoA:acetate/3-ketoacid CoA transferase beta subunit
MEVSETGDLANRMAHEAMIKGPSGAMDLVHGASRVFVVMQLCDKNGTPKIVDTCTLPLTGRAVVHRVITDLGVIDVTPAGLELIETAAGISSEDVQSRRAAHLIVRPTALTPAWRTRAPPFPHPHWAQNHGGAQTDSGIRTLWIRREVDRRLSRRHESLCQ